MSLPRSGGTWLKHVAVIPDGNRRWAKAHHLPTLVGHKKGFDRARELVRASREMGIHTMTVWAFSTENWTRAKEEVKYLMKLYQDMIEENLAEAHESQARMIHLGRKDRIPEGLAKKIAQVEEETKDYDKHVLNIALDYGGRDEILRAIAKFQELGIRNKELGEKDFEKYLDTGGQPYPDVDLMIRTSGEMRTSGFLPWQSVYAECYFAPEPFPDFTVDKFRQAIIEFGKRNRRFGGD